MTEELNRVGFRSISMLGGIQLIGCTSLTEWVSRPRLPKSRRKRIRAKWRVKYPQGALVPLEKYYVMGNSILAHPAIIERICDELKVRKAQ